ncbi:hypothetical protein QR680_017160 [Steinernema hermaphroditum]|uniref:DUF1308 domain-containing protein n=1 Tax=Steinernema hermaphroditum TaxID=289476 RepID=A0AA39HDI4_9BILA|nr:hypothetical protein QR680_017160 [Steinernema hermaphroditum]
MRTDEFSQLEFIGKLSAPPPLIVEDPTEGDVFDPINPDDFTSHHYAEKARKEAQCITDLVDNGPFHGKPGADKLKHKLRSEFRVLNSISHYEPIRMMKYVKTSNIYFYSGVRHASMKYGTRLFSFFQTFHNHAEDKSDMLKIEVDMVLDEGATWVKVIPRSSRGLAQECVTGGSGRNRSLLTQAETWLDIAQHYQHLYRPPLIIFNFIHGCPDYMKIKLNNMGVKVETPKIFPLRADPIRMDFNDSALHVPYLPNTHYDVVNLDIPAVFALISAVTNGGENYSYQSQMLNSQACQERQLRVRRYIEDKIRGKKMILCRTAYESLGSIMKTVAGPKEFERVKALLKGVKIVQDHPSERIKALKPTERINERSKIIFGTGDYNKAVTVTSNVHFVRAAASQGIRLSVIIHDPRALGEMKMCGKLPPPRAIAPGFEGDEIKPLVEPLDN